jgi:hypothetical protein
MPDDPIVAERIIVVQMLERVRAATAAELHAAIRMGVTPADIDAAVLSLAEAGVISETPGGGICVSPAVQRLDKLGLIGI